MSDLGMWIDLVKYRRRLEAARRARPPRPRRRDMDRRWKLLELLLERGAYDPLGNPRAGVRTGEIAEAMGISPSAASRALRRLRTSGMVVKLGGHFGRWFLTRKALKFAQEWGGFLDHPWVWAAGEE